MKNFKLRMWNSEDKIMLYSDNWGNIEWQIISQAQTDRRLMVCSGIKDADGRLLYEGDYVSVYNNFKEMHFKAQMIFKNAQFMLETPELSNHSRWINYEMTYIGNTYENPGLLIQDPH